MQQSIHCIDSIHIKYKNKQSDPMQLEVRKWWPLKNWLEGDPRRPLDTGFILFIDLGNGYQGLRSLWKFITLYMDKYTYFFYTYHTSILKFQSNF